MKLTIVHVDISRIFRLATVGLAPSTTSPFIQQAEMDATCVGQGIWIDRQN
jgi:hypothetical protein